MKQTWSGALRDETGLVPPGAKNRERMVFDEDVPIWEMHTGDTPKQFALFVQFRDAGPTRTLRVLSDAVARQEMLDDPPADEAARRHKIETVRVRISQIASTYRWWERCRAYDTHMDRVTLDEQERQRREAVRKATARHANVAAGLVGLGGKKLSKMHADDKDANRAISDMTIGELLAVIRDGIKLERTVLGIDRDDEIPLRGEAPVDHTPTQAVLGIEEAKRIARMAAAEATTARNDPEPPTGPPPDDSVPAGPSSSSPDGRSGTKTSEDTDGPAEPIVREARAPAENSDEDANLRPENGTG